MKEFRNLVGEAVGEASMCWSETPSGVFDSERACKIVDRICEAVERKPQLEALIAGHMEAGSTRGRWQGLPTSMSRIRRLAMTPFLLGFLSAIILEAVIVAWVLVGFASESERNGKNEMPYGGRVG